MDQLSIIYFSFSLRTCWSTTDEGWRKRGKQIFDKGFFFGNKSSTCCIPVLKFDLLFACLVFKSLYYTIYHGYYSLQMLFYYAPEKLLKKLSILDSWSESIHFQSFTSSAASNLKICVVRLHSGSLLLHANVRFSLHLSICCLCCAGKVK